MPSQASDRKLPIRSQWTEILPSPFDCRLSFRAASLSRGSLPFCQSSFRTDKGPECKKVNLLLYTFPRTGRLARAHADFFSSKPHLAISLSQGRASSASDDVAFVHHKPFQSRNSCPQSVLGFGKDERSRTVEHFVADFLLMPRKTMHELPVIFCSSALR